MREVNFRRIEYLIAAVIIIPLVLTTNALDVLGSLKNARCIIPIDVSSVSWAVLLQQCISRNHAQGNETACYEELGCFPMDSPWTTLLRPFPTPMHPNEIDVKLYLYTKGQNNRFNVQLWPNIDISQSDFKPERDRTVFITHGFASNGNASWLEDMKNAYLEAMDANVFLVDWGAGASQMNYLQVASNTRIVGAELGRFGKHLINLGLNSSNLHLIGHSLGSHISAYMAKNIAELGKPGRITALDPAQPGFEKEAKEVRLDTEDAEFVDVLHTDAKPFIPFIGFGMLFPVGHVDFYLNGGTNQPGCYTNISHVAQNINSISDLKNIPVEVINQWVSCSHGRSYQVFTTSLLPQVTCLWARKIPRIVNVLKVGSQGALRLLDPIAEKLESCEQESCTKVGFLTPDLKARGVFTMSTTQKDPFCVSDEERDRKLLNVLTLGLYGVGIKVYKAGAAATSGVVSAGSRLVAGLSTAGSRLVAGLSTAGTRVGSGWKNIVG